MREAAETEAEALRAGLVAAAKVEKERNRLQREAQAYEATIEEMKSEIESLQTNLAEKSRNIHELRNIRQEALNLQEETVHLKSEVQRLAKSSTDKARLQEDLADALAKIEELGEEAIKNARLAGERTKLHEKIEKLYEENENAKIESQSLRKAATARDKALGQIEQYLKRIEVIVTSCNLIGETAGSIQSCSLTCDSLILSAGTRRGSTAFLEATARQGSLSVRWEKRCS